MSKEYNIKNQKTERSKGMTSNFEFSIYNDLFMSQEYNIKNNKTKSKGMTFKRTMKTQPAYFWKAVLS